MLKVKEEAIIKSFEVTPATTHEFADNQHYVVVDHSFNMDFEEYKDAAASGETGLEGGTLFLYDVESQELESFTLWTNDFDEDSNTPSFYVCLPDPDDDFECIDYDLESDFGIKYSESNICSEVAVYGYKNDTDGNFFYVLNSDVLESYGKTTYFDGAFNYSLSAKQVFSKHNEANERVTFIDFFIGQIAGTLDNPYLLSPARFITDVKTDCVGQQYIQMNDLDKTIIYLNELATSPIISRYSDAI